MCGPIIEWIKHKRITFWGERADGMGDSDLTFLHRDPIQHTHRNKRTCHWAVNNRFKCNGCSISQQKAAIPVSGVGRLASHRGNGESTGIWNGIILCKRYKRYKSQWIRYTFYTLFLSGRLLNTVSWTSWKTTWKKNGL